MSEHHFIDIPVALTDEVEALWSVEYIIDDGEVDIIKAWDPEGTKADLVQMDLHLYNALIDYIAENHGDSL